MVGCKYWKQKQQLYWFKTNPLLSEYVFFRNNQRHHTYSSTGSDYATLFLMQKKKSEKKKLNKILSYWDRVSPQTSSGKFLVKKNFNIATGNEVLPPWIMPFSYTTSKCPNVLVSLLHRCCLFKVIMRNSLLNSCVQIYFILGLRKQWFVKELLMYIKPLITQK